MNFHDIGISFYFIVIISPIYCCQFASFFTFPARLWLQNIILGSEKVAFCKEKKKNESPNHYFFSLIWERKFGIVEQKRPKSNQSSWGKHQEISGQKNRKWYFKDRNHEKILKVWLLFCLWKVKKRREVHIESCDFVRLGSLNKRKENSRQFLKTKKCNINLKNTNNISNETLCKKTKIINSIVCIFIFFCL